MHHASKVADALVSRYNLPGVVNWFPGHMAKASKQVQRTLKKVDLVIEVRDARIPFSSANPELQSCLGNKRRVIVFNKAELANPNINKRLMELYAAKKEKENNAPSVYFITLKNIHTKTHADIARLVTLCFQTVQDSTNTNLSKIPTKKSSSQNESSQDALRHFVVEQDPATATKSKEKKKQKPKTNDDDDEKNKENPILQQKEILANNPKQLESYLESIPAQRKTLPETLWLVCGMPNVGKSTLINKLVGRHCAGVAAKPGWTRGHTVYRLVDVPPTRKFIQKNQKNALTLGTLKPADVESYFVPASARQRTALLMDTPGLMVPQKGIPLEVGLKLAVVGCVQPEHVFGGVVIVADYLLNCLYQLTEQKGSSKEIEWQSVLHIPPAAQHEIWPIERLLSHIQKTKKKQDEHAAAHYFISLFQEGKLGQYTLDSLPDDLDALL
jgi:ribosome biogenesis GTPase A